MDPVITYKYIMFLSPQLKGFTKVSNNLWKFRCPLCGDSEKNSNKKRGYIYEKEGTYRFHCHNCGQDKKFSGLLYEMDSELYNDYRKENALSSLKDDIIDDSLFKQSRQFPKKVEKDKYLIPIAETDINNPGREYLLSRNVPESSFKRVYWTKHYDLLINESFGEKYESIKKPTSGLVFPLFAKVDDAYSCIGYQYRTIDKECPKAKRFMTCATEGLQGLYGIEHVDFTKQIYVVEGPIDSLFLPNCIAVLTSSVWRASIPSAIYINDCEPRNKSVMEQVKKCISLNYKTVMLPEEYTSLDINDIINKYKITQSELESLVLNNVYQGLYAKVKFSKWNKI
jgi:transcription elongation factor Elf1